MSDMRRREFTALVGGVGLLLAAKVRRARAQQAAIPVVGFLSSGQPQVFAHMIDAFRQGLNETGYVVGQNVAFEHRASGSEYDRFRAMDDDLVRRQVAVIFATLPRRWQPKRRLRPFQSFFTWAVVTLKV